jgi:protein-disulfide isomerase
MKNIITVIIAASLLLFSLSAWTASTKEEVKALKVQVDAVQKDLAEIKKLVKERARAPAKRVETPFKKQVVNVEGLPFQGKADATVTMLEFSDYQCPYCASFNRKVIPTLVKEYVDTGKLKYVIHEYPAEKIHPHATNASMAALCAGDQDKYWEMHNLMFENQGQLGIEYLKDYAETIGLDTASFNECLDSKKYLKQITDGIASSKKRFGVRVTPSLMLGLTDQDDPDKVNMSLFLIGERVIVPMQREIDKLLDAAK